MPSSLSDFCAQVTAHVGAKGTVFSVSVNPDGSVQISRAASSTSGAPTVLFPRVIYNTESDTVLLGDGASMTASTASAFISGLN